MTPVNVTPVNGTPTNGASANGHIEMQRRLEIQLPRESLLRAKQFSMSLQFEDAERNVVGNLEHRFDIDDHPSDLSALLLRLNVSVHPQD